MVDDDKNKLSAECDKLSADGCLIDKHFRCKIWKTAKNLYPDLYRSGWAESVENVRLNSRNGVNFVSLNFCSESERCYRIFGWTKIHISFSVDKIINIPILVGKCNISVVAFQKKQLQTMQRHKSGARFNGKGQLPNKVNLDERIALGITREVLTCPFHANSVSTRHTRGWLFAAGANREKCTEIWNMD